MGFFSGGLLGSIVDSLISGGSSGSGYSGSTSRGSGSLGSISSGVIQDSRRDQELVRSVIKESDTLAGEFLRTVDDAKDELHELCTDGFVEMVIKGNKDYKTSFEIKEEADEKIGAARYSYQERCYKLNETLDVVNKKINDLYKQKVELAKKINRTIDSSPNMPKVPMDVYSPSYSYKPSTIHMLCSYSGLTKMADIKGRKESAKEYLEDAKDFEVELYGKIAEMNRIEVFLNTIKITLEEEEMLLTALKDSMNSRRNLPYDKLSEQLYILISEYILDPSGKKNEKYVEAIAQLRKI